MNLHYRKALFFNKSLQNSICPTITLMFLYYSEMPKPQINLISGFTVNVLCSLRSSDDHSGLYQPFIPNHRFLWRAQFCKARACSCVWCSAAFLENHWSMCSGAADRGPVTQLCNRGQWSLSQCPTLTNGGLKVLSLDSSFNLYPAIIILDIRCLIELEVCGLFSYGSREIWGLGTRQGGKA